MSPEESIETRKEDKVNDVNVLRQQDNVLKRLKREAVRVISRHYETRAKAAIIAGASLNNVSHIHTFHL